FQVKKLKESPNEMWFEVTVESSDFKEKKKEYNYIVKAKVSKRFIFNPKLEIYSVVIVKSIILCKILYNVLHRIMDLTKN
ncbi:hypothetical protein KJZ25_17220, partial [Enterococcus faecalis]|nr:hypothetical protein [Enterococcus faecalis]